MEPLSIEGAADGQKPQDSTRRAGAPIHERVAVLLLVLALGSAPVIAVWSVRNTFPAPAGLEADGFSEARAHMVLQAVTAEPHPVLRVDAGPNHTGHIASNGSVAVFELLKEELLAIAEAAASTDRVVEVQVPSEPIRIHGPGPNASKGYDYVAARLRSRRVSDAYEKALLLTAHFDSVVPGGQSEWLGEAVVSEMGVGAADDGVGTVVVLESFRVLATQQTEPFTDVIVLLTNGEEMGYLGMKAFMQQSPWGPDVGFFIQMDQRGSRGIPQAVFGDSTVGEALAATAYHKGARYPRATVLLKDFETWRGMRTDGTWLREEYSVPGIGNYMMEDHCPYHTIYDTVDHAIQGNIQVSGETILGVARVLTTDEALLDRWARGDPDLAGRVYYLDVLSSYFLLWTRLQYLGMSVLLVCFLALACIFAARSPQGGGPKVLLFNVAMIIPLHLLSILAGLATCLLLAQVLGSMNFAYWYHRDPLAYWVYAGPCATAHLALALNLSRSRFSSGLPHEEAADVIERRASLAAVTVFLIIHVILLALDMRLSLTFFLCAATRLAGHMLRHGLSALLVSKPGEGISRWLWVLEFAVALIGVILPLDDMRFNIVNLTSSKGRVGGVLPGELTVGLLAGLLLSVAFVQSGAATILVLHTEWGSRLPLGILLPALVLVVVALAVPVHEYYPCIVPGVV